MVSEKPLVNGGINKVVLYIVLYCTFPDDAFCFIFVVAGLFINLFCRLLFCLLLLLLLFCFCFDDESVGSFPMLGTRQGM